MTALTILGLNDFTPVTQSEVRGKTQSLKSDAGANISSGKALLVHFTSFIL